MLTAVFVLGSFLLFQLGAINASTSSFNMLMVILGAYGLIYLLIGWMTRNVRINAISQQIEPVWQQYQACYGNQAGRRAFADFGSGFGEGFAEVAAESGDVIGTLIGAGISAISGFFGNAKSPEQQQMEAIIAQGLKEIDAAKERFIVGAFVFVTATGIFCALSHSGTLPFR